MAIGRLLTFVVVYIVLCCHRESCAGFSDRLNEGKLLVMTTVDACRRRYRRGDVVHETDRSAAESIHICHDLGCSRASILQPDEYMLSI